MKRYIVRADTEEKCLEHASPELTARRMVEKFKNHIALVGVASDDRLQQYA